MMVKLIKANNGPTYQNLSLKYGADILISRLVLAALVATPFRRVHEHTMQSATPS
jgi:hypothetical protein